MKLTRSEILTLPAEQLAEVSARMMVWEIVANKSHCVIKLTPKNLTVIWGPNENLNDAGTVADWVGEEWSTLTPKRRPECKTSDPREAIDFALSEVMGTESNHWAWTPEQLTRAILLAFVDTSQGNLGGDVRLLANELDGGEI